MYYLFVDIKHFKHFRIYYILKDNATRSLLKLGHYSKKIKIGPRSVPLLVVL